MLKLSWKPPKRVWGTLSDDAFNLLKNKGFIKSDEAIMRGIAKGNENILRRYGYDPKKFIKETSFRDLLTLNPREFFYRLIALIGPSYNPLADKIYIPRKNSRYHKLIKNVIPGINPLILRHEIDEMRGIRKGHVMEGILYRPLGKSKKIPTARHTSFGVIARESNNSRWLRNKELEPYRKISNESALFNLLLGKTYGKDYINPRKAEKILDKPGYAWLYDLGWPWQNGEFKRIEDNLGKKFLRLARIIAPKRYKEIKEYIKHRR